LTYTSFTRHFYISSVN